MPPLITEQDRRRLSNLLDVTSADAGSLGELAARLLRAKLEAARLVAAHEMPPNIVTLNSHVICWDMLAGAEAQMTLVYPAEDDPVDGKVVSILSPLGVELLGAHAGQTLSRDDDTTWRLVAVAYQPEAAGHFHL